MTESGWIEEIPSLRALDGPARERLAAGSRLVSLPAGSRIFGPGQAPESFLILIEGSIRVQQVSAGGREIVLYRVAGGETCALTTACLLGYDAYPAEAVAETAVRAAAVPRRLFDELVAGSEAFRGFVFGAFSARVTDLCRVIEEVAFARMDIRLAHKLLALADAQGRLGMTHQQLAAELGTAREVVSRQLHELERRGLVRIGRGAITIADQAALERLAAVD